MFTLAHPVDNEVWRACSPPSFHECLPFSNRQTAQDALYSEWRKYADLFSEFTAILKWCLFDDVTKFYVIHKQGPRRVEKSGGPTRPWRKPITGVWGRGGPGGRAPGGGSGAKPP